MRRNLCLVFVVLLVILLSGCVTEQTAPSIRFPYLWLDEQGYGGDIDKQAIEEPSGIVFHPLRKTLFVVSDEGHLAEIGRDGQALANYDIPGDLEGLTVDPSTGLVYVLIEGEETILEFDPEAGREIRRFAISREFQGDKNFLQKQTDAFDNGCESIAFVPSSDHKDGGYFVVANQWDPPMLLVLDVPLKSSTEASAEARITKVLPFSLDDPAGMYYDSETGLLNVVSDADNILVELTLDGKIAREYAFLGDNQEGITRDDEGYLYIAQDSGGILKVKDLR